MGCWGITALESDAGLDALELIRKNLPKDGRMKVKELLKIINEDEWNKPPVTEAGESHTGVMMLAELMVKFQDGTIQEMEFIPQKPFEKIVSFTADYASVVWMKSYLFDTLEQAKANAENGIQWNGWFQEEDWSAWQIHMKNLVERLSDILQQNIPEMELIQHAENKMTEQQELMEEGFKMGF